MNALKAWKVSHQPVMVHRKTYGTREEAKLLIDAFGVFLFPLHVILK